MLKLKTKTLLWNSEEFTTKEGVTMLKVNVILCDKIVPLYVNNDSLIKEVNKIPQNSFVDLELEFYLTNEGYWKTRLLSIDKSK